MKNWLRSIMGALALAWMLACGGPSAAPPAEAAEAESSSGLEAQGYKAAFDRAHHMQATLWLALVARDALTNGDLAGAQSAARALAEHDFQATIAADWQPFMREAQEHAGALARAGNLADASQALAAVALSCGHCHYQMSAGPKVGSEPPVEWQAGPDTVKERMERHAEGAEHMWIGLVDPSNEAWRSGTVSLTRAPLAPPAAAAGSADTRSTQAIERVRFLARRARAAATYPERGQIYGELIATCGACHTATP